MTKRKGFDKITKNVIWKKFVDRRFSDTGKEVVRRMAVEDIQKILDAEKKADERRGEAAAEAARILEQAEAEGQKLYDRLVRDAEEQAEQIRLRAAEEIRKTSEIAVDAAARDCVSVKNDAAPRLDAAAALICERIVNG